MGVIFGIVNIIVAIWFFSSAASVNKKAVLWAAIGGLSFLAFKFFGYSFIALFQDTLDQSALDDLTSQGYEASERSATALSSETADEQSTAAGILYEFFPVIVALSGVAFIRAKFILGMGFIDSLKHKTPLSFKRNQTAGDSSESSEDQGSFLANLWKQFKDNLY